MSFGMYLVAIFCPPLYFAIRGRWIAAILHGINCVIALPMMFFFGFGIVMWVFSAGHACWDLGSERQRKQIEAQAEAIARKMTQVN